MTADTDDIEILPAPGVGKTYEISRAIFSITGTAATFPHDLVSLPSRMRDFDTLASPTDEQARSIIWGRRAIPAWVGNGRRTSSSYQAVKRERRTFNVGQLDHWFLVGDGTLGAIPGKSGRGVERK